MAKRASTELGDILRNLRQKRADGSSFAEFGRAIGVSGQFIGSVERGDKRISEKLAQKIADRYGKDPEDRAQILRQLLSASAAMVLSDTSGALNSFHPYFYAGPPPGAFLGLLHEALETRRTSKAHLASALTCPVSHIRQVLDGQAMCTPAGVRKIADEVRIAQDKLLLAAGYLPQPCEGEGQVDTLAQSLATIPSSGVTDDNEAVRRLLGEIMDRAEMAPDDLAHHCRLPASAVHQFLEHGEVLTPAEQLALTCCATEALVERFDAPPEPSATPPLSSAASEMCALLESLSDTEQRVLLRTLRAMAQSAKDDET